MAVNIIMEKSTFTGRDSSGKEHYRAVMLADTTDELPPPGVERDSARAGQQYHLDR